MLLDSDKLLLLNIIKTGNYQKVLSLKTNLDYIKNSSITYTLKQNPNSYKMANNITNVLFPADNVKIKKQLNNLIALELNHYDRGKEQDKVYTQLKTLSTNLVAFPTQKRLNKFLTTFVKASKSLQNFVIKEDNYNLIKTSFSKSRL